MGSWSLTLGIVLNGPTQKVNVIIFASFNVLYFYFQLLACLFLMDLFILLKDEYRALLDEHSTCNPSRIWFGYR